MDQKTPALQYYNGGIIFVSYVIAVVGAMTTLELLQRRTHIRGRYNW
jgi:NO-binding membrane sensor protein with MHYT domain